MPADIVIAKLDVPSQKVFEKLNIRSDTILIGHSAGGAFSVRWLGETKKKIKKLILIAASKKTTKESERIKEFCNFEIDHEINKLTKEIVIFISNDTEETIESADIYQKELNAKLIRLENRGHFTFRGMGTNEFPELLEEVLKTK